MDAKWVEKKYGEKEVARRARIKATRAWTVLMLLREKEEELRKADVTLYLSSAHADNLKAELADAEIDLVRSQARPDDDWAIKDVQAERDDKLRSYLEFDDALRLESREKQEASKFRRHSYRAQSAAQTREERREAQENEAERRRRAAALSVSISKSVNTTEGK